MHALRALAPQHPKQVLQVGLQRRYSKYFQATKDMVDKGILGNVTHIHAMWHRNPGWVMKPGGRNNGKNWRLFRDYSGGLTAELASHHIDAADWMFGGHPEFVMGLGGLDTWKDDGRDIFDNIQLIYQYSGGRKVTYSAISTNSHMPYFCSTRPEFGMCIMGTAGAVEITIGDGQKTMPTALWYREPNPTKVALAGEKTKTEAGATFALAGPQKGLPITDARVPGRSRQGLVPDARDEVRPALALPKRRDDSGGRRQSGRDGTLELLQRFDERRPSQGRRRSRSWRIRRPSSFPIWQWIKTGACTSTKSTI